MIWLESTADGTCKRKIMTIQLCNDSQGFATELKVFDARSIKYILENFMNMNHEMAFEGIELAHEVNNHKDNTY